jgi:formylglycine-generating enzyme required for sulfatase activity
MSSFFSPAALSRLTEGILCVPFEWCSIQGGPVTLENAMHYGGTQGGTVQVADFMLARYPITNAQYARFLEHPNGYTNPRWWEYSQPAQQWRIDHPHPQPSAFDGANLPRTRVSWFDSLAFCHWLSGELQNAGGAQQLAAPQVYLPTEAEWQRGALGDSGWEYPWGNELDETRANYGSLVGSPTAVDSYPLGQSPYQILDLIGNVWEWCLTAWGSEDGDEHVDGYPHRVIRGGAWNVSNPEYLRAASRGGHPPRGRLNDCGFRIAYKIGV